MIYAIALEIEYYNQPAFVTTIYFGETRLRVYKTTVNT